jgi:hypothetical protein
LPFFPDLIGTEKVAGIVPLRPQMKLALQCQFQFEQEIWL